jgi:hypothetical protein
MNKLPAITVSRKTGAEPFLILGKDLPFNLLNFWQWSSSDITGNALRGILAEYIVATAVGCADDTRAEWDAFDLINRDGVKIEVKSCAYIQSWEQKDFSSISFGIQPTKAWDESLFERSNDQKRQSDVYVFCLLTHKDQDTINPLHLDQWDFFVISTNTLNLRLGNQKKITLPSLKKLKPLHVKYEGLDEAICQASK